MAQQDDAAVLLYEVLPALHGVSPESLGWNANDATPCAWRHVTCDPITRRVNALLLGSANLTGTLSSSIALLKGLTQLDVQQNQLGASLPAQLSQLPRLAVLSAGFNNFTGRFPAEYSAIPTLRSLLLSHNSLRGRLPTTVAAFRTLEALDLGHNTLWGPLPNMQNLQALRSLGLPGNAMMGSLDSRGLSALSNLEALDLSSNQFVGEIPSELGGLKELRSLSVGSNQLSMSLPPQLADLTALTSLNVSNNQLGGALPPQLGSLSQLHSASFQNNNFSGQVPSYPWLANPNGSFLFAGNPNLCSYSDLDLPPCPGPAPPLAPPATGPPAPGPAAQPSGASSSTGLVVGVVLGVVGLLLALLALALALWHRGRRRRNASTQKQLNGAQADDRAEALTSTPDTGTDALLGPSIPPLGLGQGSRQGLQRISYAELLSATERFSEARRLGEGGSGVVYQGELSTAPGETQLVAVKRLKLDGIRGSPRRHLQQELMAEVGLLSRAAHRNIIRLIGYCQLDEDSPAGPALMLVYPLMHNGSVQDHLLASDGKRRAPVLPWSVRCDVARGTAQGLAYMHHDCTPRVIHRDIKAANVLLNDRFEAAVCDFGLSRLMEASLDDAIAGKGAGGLASASAIKGTAGHIAPEYLRMGQLSEKTDVFAFGVLLLQLVTGHADLAAFVTARNPGTKGVPDVALRDWVLDHMDRGKVHDLVDPEVLSQLDHSDKSGATLDEARHLLQLALLCLAPDPRQRPSMKECVDLLAGRGLQTRWDEWQQQQQALLTERSRNREMSRLLLLQLDALGAGEADLEQTGGMLPSAAGAQESDLAQSDVTSALH